MSPEPRWTSRFLSLQLGVEALCCSACNIRKARSLNATFEKFGWPRTRIAESEEWAVLLRPDQPALGSLVLACKQPVKAFSYVDAKGFADLGQMVQRIETLLTSFVSYEKINYLMLMMVDPDVHFHVIPRYEGDRSFGGIEISDAGWPGPPALGTARTLTEPQIDAMVAHLVAQWPQ